MPSCCCCFPWRELLAACLGALWRRAKAEVLGCCTICLCGQTVYTLDCGHSWHHRPPQQFPRCPICHSRGNDADGTPSPVCSAAAGLDEQEPLVLLPPPPSRFVHARGEAEAAGGGAASSSSVQASGSGVQELSSSS